MSNASDSSLGVPLVKSGTQGPLDVRKESDVIELLRLLHQNPVDQETKNHVRDLVFEYRQTANPLIGQQLREQFASLGVDIVFEGIAPQQKAVQKEKTKRSALGSTRPQPRFTRATVADAPASVSAPKPPTPPAPASETTPTPQPHAETPEGAQETSAMPSESPVSEGSQEAGERIKEIKRLVNEKVGNPVNLIDAHEAVGREYMNALLDAMKKSNGAPAGELRAAMDRLELAFKQVQEVIFTNPDATPVRVAPVAHEKTSVAPEPQKAPEPVAEAPAAAREVKAEPEPEQVIPLSVSSEKRPPERPAAVRMSSVRENLAASMPIAEPIPPEAPASTPVHQEAPVTPQPETALHSVAKEKQLQDLLRANREQQLQEKAELEEAKIAQMDPLYAPEVTAGLNQLLSEWNLFKSSGILGTGPKGKDHPLYKKLQALTMAGVIAGRFEGANAAIKQSITDYMNGWRYEEGIAHDHGETFEHYLRRVVRHILNRKQTK